MNKSADDTIVINDIGGLPHVKGFLQLYVPYTMIHMISTIIGTLGYLNIHDYFNNFKLNIDLFSLILI